MTPIELTRRDAVGALYCDHGRWLHGWLHRRLGCVHQAADLAHDTFALILASRDVSALREPRAYLRTLAKGLMINWFRRQALERAYLEALAALPEPQAPPPEQRLIVLETLAEIDAMLDGLRPKAKQAFLLSQIEGLTYEQIAQQLRVSLPSVKRYMQRAFYRCLALLA